MKNTHKTSECLLVAVGLLLAPNAAQAFGGKIADDPACGATCCYTIPDKVLSGDEWYGANNWDWCRSDWMNAWVDNYGATHDDWPGDSWGWTDACNTDKPLARFFTALAALNSSHPHPVSDGNYDLQSPLDWGRHFAPDQIDELAARCPNGGFSAMCVNCIGSFLGIHGDRSVELYLNYFFQDSVMVRAADLVHESWHWAFERDHVAGGVKDQSYSNDSGAGAYSVTVWWLSRYAREAVNAPWKLRCEAADSANAYINGSFVQVPAITVDLLAEQGVDCAAI